MFYFDLYTFHILNNLIITLIWMFSLKVSVMTTNPDMLESQGIDAINKILGKHQDDSLCLQTLKLVLICSTKCEENRVALIQVIWVVGNWIKQLWTVNFGIGNNAFWSHPTGHKLLCFWVSWSYIFELIEPFEQLTLFRVEFCPTWVNASALPTQKLSSWLPG